MLVVMAMDLHVIDSFTTAHSNNIDKFFAALDILHTSFSSDPIFAL